MVNINKQPGNKQENYGKVQIVRIYNHWTHSINRSNGTKKPTP